MERDDLEIRPAVVAHAGARDFFQVALALKEDHLLTDLVTDFYISPSALQRLKRVGLHRLESFAARRSCEGLELAPFQVMPAALSLALMAEKSRHPSRWWSKSDDLISRAALKRAQETESNLYLYSYYAYEAFRRSEGEDRKKILFQVHPHPVACKEILEEEMRSVPSAAASLSLEREVNASEEDIAKSSHQAHMADHIVVASSFTKRTLLEQGIPSDRIAVIPYGVDARAFPERTEERAQDGPLRIAFLGSFVQRKGASYLVEAIRSFPPGQVKLIVATRSLGRNTYPAPGIHDNIEFRLGLTRQELVPLLQGCDVFVLPSLVEGFAHSILEAMSTGLPVIATPNTCAADLVQDGHNGFIVPIRSAEALRRAIQACLDRRGDLAEMGRRAARTARAHSWPEFRRRISRDYRSLLEAG